MSNDYIDNSDGPIEYTREQAVAELWNMGVLHWKLHDTQKEIYNAFKNIDGQKFVINSSRRLGKSFLLCVIAIEFALTHPGSRICYAAPTAKAVKKIISPIFKIILEDCPKHLRPKWKVQDQVYQFNNGAEIHVAGTDAERAEALRGQSMDLGLVDEAGFMSELDYVVSDILMPQTLTTGGKIIIASTPPKTPAHDFTKYAMDAELRGYYIKKTIYDNPMIKKKTIIKFMVDTEPSLTEAMAEELYNNKSGPKNSTWQREYMGQFVTDEDLSIIPEFNEESEKELIQDVEKPPFFDAYVSMDIGYNDYTVVLFGYWHFFKGVLIIEDELVLSRMTSQALANGIKEKEILLWNHKKPYLRVSDTDPIVINDLTKMHGITFIPTPKDNKESAINKLRMFVQDKKILINPRCKNLIAQLKFGVWNKQKTQFERSGEYGHFDAIDSLVYMVRNIQSHRNPVPVNHGLNIHQQFIPPTKKENFNERQVRKMFNLNRFFPDFNKK